MKQADNDENVLLKLPAWKNWYVLGVIYFLFFFDLADRAVISPLSPLIKKEFNLSDAQIGLLSSVVLAMVCLFSIPLSYIIDRWRRGKMISLMSIVWSLAELFSGLAMNFTHLLTARIGLGVGESSFNSGGQAMIMATTKKSRRTTITGIWATAQAIGMAVGMILGGWIGVNYGWRMAFIALAIPGIIFGILAWFLPDYKNPPREMKEKDGTNALGFGKTLKNILKTKSLVFLFIAYGLIVFLQSTLIYWLPTYLVRFAGMELTLAGTLSGLIIITALVAGPFGGWLGDKVSKKAPRNKVIVIWIAALLSIVAFFSALLFNIWALFFVVAFMFFVLVPPQQVALQELVPHYQRASSFGVYTFSMYVFGGLWAPVVIGMISDASNLKTAFWVGGAVTLVSILLYLLVFKSYNGDYERARQQEQDIDIATTQ